MGHFLRAVRKLTREIKEIVRERVLTWYNREGIEKDITLLLSVNSESDYFNLLIPSRLHQCNTLSVTNFLSLWLIF